MCNERFVLHNTREVRRASGEPTRGLDHFNHSVTGESTLCNGELAREKAEAPRERETAPVAHAEARTTGAVPDVGT